MGSGEAQMEGREDFQATITLTWTREGQSLFLS